MHTEELIIQTATRLFNQLGTARVTTNHIAREAGISPGNLYYYYKDKSHILREIYEQMITAWDGLYAQVDREDLSQQSMYTFIEANFELLWQYRFFYRETIALIQTDPLLSKRHVEITQSRFEKQRSFLRKMSQIESCESGGTSINLDEALTIAWVVANHYLIHLESMGQTVEKTDFKAGANLVTKVLQSYLHE